MLSTSFLVFILVGVEINLFPCQAYHVILSPENGEDAFDSPDDRISVSDYRQQQQIKGSQVSRGLAPVSISSKLNMRNSMGNNRELDQDKEVLSFTDTLLKNIAKRTTFANTEDELQKLEMDFNDNESPGVIGIGLLRKRTETEQHSGGCEAKKQWISLGSDHFPRFIKSYNCTSDTCNRNFGECRPKSYSVKVLRMNSPENASLLEEGCDPHLPEKLRCDWKLVPVVVTTYCECFSDISQFGR